MQIKGAPSDGFRVSVSSAFSTSSYGSAQDENDALGDVYMWGEIVCDNSARAITERNLNPYSARVDILLPKPLDSNVILDIHHVACGVRHAALLTRQGEVFTWGEESGGRLGLGVGTHAFHPCLVESLSACNIDFIACGEFHTCAVSIAGELYTWGDGTHNAGLLGHGNDASHWIPRRVSGPLEGLQVAYVTCGTWHTALITSAGQLFTFGDGTFGVLGHGNRESVFYPREVESLMGLKTIAVSCGVWHTAAVVEVIVTQFSASSGKLFTWGDGDKYRLGHGDKEPHLKPTCVPSLIDYNFYKLACGHSLTIGLTTSGHIFTMGSTVYGQLGNPNSDGKLPCLVEDKLSSESIKDVACGSYHVAVLTTRGEVYTWGKGANGRLGHGDLEDRKAPTLVEVLKDRPVKRIACGSNFTAAICHHKWVSGSEQSQCSACRQAFGFTRKRRNCYNCGLVHCHSCSSRKALRAALSPNPGRPYRVCDSCYLKLTKCLETGGTSERRNVPCLSGESKDRSDKAETKTALSGNLGLTKNLDTKPAKQARKSDSLSTIPTPMLELTDIAFAGVDLYRAFPKPVTTSVIQSANDSRTASPFSRKASPPRSATPIPTMSGLTFSKSATDSLKKTNDLLNRELQKLHAQVDILTQRYELQEFEVQKSEKKAKEAIQLAAEESAKSKAAKEVIKSLTAQLKDMAGRLPNGTYAPFAIKPRYLSNGIEPLANHRLDMKKENQRNEGSNRQNIPPSIATHSALKNGNHSALKNGTSGVNPSERENHETDEMCTVTQAVADSNAMNEHFNVGSSSKRETPTSTIKIQQFDAKQVRPLQNIENRSRLPPSATNQIESEWIEQYEPGVYITLMALHDGMRELKRVRFSRRRFGEQQAETWWTENREKVYEKYNVCGSERNISSGLPRSPC